MLDDDRKSRDIGIISLYYCYPLLTIESKPILLPYPYAPGYWLNDLATLFLQHQIFACSSVHDSYPLQQALSTAESQSENCKPSCVCPLLPVSFWALVSHNCWTSIYVIRSNFRHFSLLDNKKHNTVIIATRCHSPHQLQTIAGIQRIRWGLHYRSMQFPTVHLSSP